MAFIMVMVVMMIMMVVVVMDMVVMMVNEYVVNVHCYHEPKWSCTGQTGQT